MKKYLVAMTALFLFIGCSSDDSSEVEDKDNEVAKASTLSNDENETKELDVDEESTSDTENSGRDIEDYAWNIYTIERQMLDELRDDAYNGKVVMVPADAEELEQATIEEFTGEARPEWTSYLTQMYYVAEKEMSIEYRDALMDVINAVTNDPVSVPSLVEKAREIRLGEGN